MNDGKVNVGDYLSVLHSTLRFVTCIHFFGVLVRITWYNDFGAYTRERLHQYYINVHRLHCVVVRILERDCTFSPLIPLHQLHWPPAPLACLLLSSRHGLNGVVPRTPHVIWEIEATSVRLEHYMYSPIHAYYNSEFKRTSLYFFNFFARNVHLCMILCVYKIKSSHVILQCP
jgi:hypothetical protein